MVERKRHRHEGRRWVSSDLRGNPWSCSGSLAHSWERGYGPKEGGEGDEGGTHGDEEKEDCLVEWDRERDEVELWRQDVSYESGL